jgi:hypothetical protein
MSKIVSLYSEAVIANVPNDQLAPKAPVLGQTTMIQATDSGATPDGKSKVTLNWAIPLENDEVGGDFIGVADGNAQDFETSYDPIIASSYSVFEKTGYNASGLDTNLSAASAIGDWKLPVNNTTNINIGDIVEISDGTIKEYAKILNFVTDVSITLETRLIATAFASGSTVKAITSLTKVESTDYTIDANTGVISLIAGQFTSGDEVFVSYTTTLLDLDHFELYKIKGNYPVSADSTYADVLADSNVETVNTAISSNTVTFEDVFLASENAEDYTYYLFAIDDETSANVSRISSVFVELLPSIPQNISKSVSENSVFINWDIIVETNTDGVNIYRSTGSSFDASIAIKLNTALITTGSFEDSVNNTTNRVDEATAPYPQNGNPYTYKVEAEDTITTWTIGTANQSLGVPTVSTASKG